MKAEILLQEGYKKFNQPDGEPTLYQKKIKDDKGIKYFINCYHYNFPNMNMNTWEFDMQTTSKAGTINTRLFNTEINIHQIEVFLECAWKDYGSNYYEIFVLVGEGGA